MANKDSYGQRPSTLIGEVVKGQDWPLYRCPKCGKVKEEPTAMTGVLGSPVCSGRHRQGVRQWHDPTPMERKV